MAQPRDRSLLHARATTPSTPARNTRRSPMTRKSPLKISNSPHRNTTTTSSIRGPPLAQKSPLKTLGIYTPSKQQRRGMVEVEDEEPTAIVQETPIKTALTEDENSSGETNASLSTAPKKNHSPVTQELEAFEIKVKEEGGLIEEEDTTDTPVGDLTNEATYRKSNGKTAPAAGAGNTSYHPGVTMTNLRPYGKENARVPALAPFNYHQASFDPMYSAPHSSSFDGSAFGGIAFQERGHSPDSGPPLAYPPQYHSRYYPPPHAYYPPQYRYGNPNMDDSNTSQKSHLETASPLGNNENSTENNKNVDKTKNGPAPPGLRPASTGDMMCSGPPSRGASPYSSYPPNHHYSCRPSPYFGYGTGSPYYAPYGGPTSTTRGAHEGGPASLEGIETCNPVVAVSQAAGEEKVASKSPTIVVKKEDTSNDETMAIGIRDCDKKGTTPPMPLLQGK
jgi:hypothetical protein